MTDNNGLIVAYTTTIEDLEIAIKGLGLFEFKQHSKYLKEIREYENKIAKLEYYERT